MTSYIVYDILKPSVFWKIWWRGPLTLFMGGGSDGLDPTLLGISAVVAGVHRKKIFRQIRLGVGEM